MKKDIGRRTFFGNPFFARKGEELQGRTLDEYRRYLDARRRDEQWAIDVAVAAGIPQPPHTFEEELILLGYQISKGVQLRCPGCKEHSCRMGICHGYDLQVAAVDAWNTANGQ
jgi:hypothetical protein